MFRKEPTLYFFRVKAEAVLLSTLHNLPELPIYALPKKMLTTQEAINVLLSFGLEESSICSRVPFGVEINSAFVVDLNKLNSTRDILCDDMGVWTWGGSTKRWINVDKRGFVTFLKEKPVLKTHTMFGRGIML